MKNYLKKRLTGDFKMHIISCMRTKNWKAIDLFCGCGGISLGLEMAGFSVLAGIDIEKKHLKTFVHNFPNAKAFCDDLRKIEAENLLSSLGLKRGELDLLAGGPPCQGFSKNVPRSKREADSSNNLLMETYLDFCEKIYGIIPLRIPDSNLTFLCIFFMEIIQKIQAYRIKYT